jgi:pSer/pThr/pTyr-binding forkhead associated (FHA) protein
VALADSLAVVSGLLSSLPVVPAVPSLVFRRPGRSRSERVAIGRSIVAGRATAVDLSFPDAGDLSRRHFSVSREAEGYFVEDLDSANGTFLGNGSDRVKRRELRDGDLIRAGGLTFLFVRPDPESLLEALPDTPSEPALVFRRPGEWEAETFPLNPGLVVGRGQDCGICFRDLADLSRRHFRVVREENDCIVEDLESGNGTFIDGLGRVKRHLLSPGDFILAGGIDFLYFVPGEATCHTPGLAEIG